MGETASTHQKKTYSPLHKNPQKVDPNIHPTESEANLEFPEYHFKQCFSSSLAATFIKKYILSYDGLVHTYVLYISNKSFQKQYS